MFAQTIFIAKRVRNRLAWLSVKPLFIDPGSPWENVHVESFNGKMRDELLDREIFHTVNEAMYLIEMLRQEYNQLRPHSSLSYRPPVPSTWTSIAESIERVSLT